MEIKDIASIFGVLVALGLGVYNGWRTRKVALMVDSLLLDDRRFELLRMAIDTQTLRTREKTSLCNLRYKLHTKMFGLLTTDKEEVQKALDQADKLIDDLGKDIASDRDLVQFAHDSMAPTTPEPGLIQSVNKLLGRIKARHSDTLLQQATTNGFISDAENLLAAAQSHTNSTR